MNFTVLLIPLMGCKPPPAEDPIYVDGTQYSLSLQAIPPLDQPNLFTYALRPEPAGEGLKLIIRQATGETSSHILSGRNQQATANNKAMPPLEEATLSLVAYEWFDVNDPSLDTADKNKIFYHGSSKPITIAEGELTVPIFAARNGRVAELGQLPDPRSLAPVVADGQGAFWAFGGVSNGVQSMTASNTITKLDLAQPDRSLTFTTIATKLPDNNTATGWVGQTANRLGGSANDELVIEVTNSGDILIAGGAEQFPNADNIDDIQPSNRSFRFNPTDETIIETSPMAHKRVDHRSAPMPIGDILVAGGFGEDGALNTSVEVYQADTDTWSAFEDQLTTGVVFQSMARLKNQGVLSCGGLTAGENPHYSAECVKLTPSHQIEPADSMETPLLFTNLITLADGRVLRTGGLEAFEDHSGFLPDEMTATDAVYIYEQEQWRQVGSMKNARAMHSTTLLPGGRVLIIGGVTGIRSNGSADQYNGLFYDHAEALACAEIFDPETEQFSSVDACGPSSTGATLGEPTVQPAVATDPIFGSVISGGIGTNRGQSVTNSIVLHPAYSTSN